jgi:metal-dependent amidase/aminoacylase/carboxypeptidase family protein
MIKEGCMKGVDECYGYHNLPMDKEGVLMVKPNLVMVRNSILSIYIYKYNFFYIGWGH